jgi:RNA polymerase sigma-70 factor (ECF subfamily)
MNHRNPDSTREQPAAAETPAGGAAHGDERLALETVLRDHQGAIYGYLRSRLLQDADAEDLTQEVFMRWYAGRQKFDAARELRPWLVAIARNVLREHLKRLRTRREVAWTELCLELEKLVGFDDEDGAYHEAAMFLPGCIESLGPSARQALEMRYRMQMKLAAIGQKLHRSEGAVKLLMLRARQALRQCLNRKLERGPA